VDQHARRARPLERSQERRHRVTENGGETRING
jgi:hypothetical protein